MREFLITTSISQSRGRIIISFWFKLVCSYQLYIMFVVVASAKQRKGPILVPKKVNFACMCVHIKGRQKTS